MKALRIVAFGAAALCLLAFLAGALLPSEWRVERTVWLAAPPASVFREIADARALAAWFPPPSASAASDAGVVTWRTERGGACSLRIGARVAAERVELELVRFGASERATIALAPEGTGTRVHWQQAGDVGRNPVMRACRTLFAARTERDVDAAVVRLRAVLERAAAR